MGLKNQIVILGLLLCCACRATKIVGCDSRVEHLLPTMKAQIGEYYSYESESSTYWKVVEIECLNDSMIEVYTKTKSKTKGNFKFGNDGKLFEVSHRLPDVY